MFILLVQCHRGHTINFDPECRLLLNRQFPRGEVTWPWNANASALVRHLAFPGSEQQETLWT